MKTLTLGNTGQKVSSFCLGTMYFGTTCPEETAFKLLDLYYEAGGRFIDTANNYSFWVEGGKGGESEALIGRWMKDRENREELFVATKVGGLPTKDKGGMADAEGLSPKVVERAVKQSLERLQTDYIDLYYAHIDHRNAPYVTFKFKIPPEPLNGVIEGFNSLHEEGTVKNIGCSNYYPWRIERARQISQANNWAQFCCVQQRYTYLQPAPGAKFTDGLQLVADEALFDYTSNNDMTVLAYSSLLGGSYTREDRPIPEPYRTPNADVRLKALTTVAGETGATKNQVVLAWLMQGEPPIIPITSASKPEQLEEVLEAVDLNLTTDQLKLLSQAGATFG